jgi:hypothetical protein
MTACAVILCACVRTSSACVCVCVCVFYYGHAPGGYGPLQSASYIHSVFKMPAPVQKPTMRPAYRLSNTMLNIGKKEKVIHYLKLHVVRS